MQRRLFLHIGLLLAVLIMAAPAAAVEIKLAKYPDYANGKIVFTYLGDLWLVNEDGTQPRRLTVHDARDMLPRFSPDAQWIAFSSNRQGNHDVYVMPAEGGKAKQLTWYSGPDMVVGWTPDSKKVIFSSSRGLLYPGIPNLYCVPVAGGQEEPLPTDWGTYAAFSADGKKLAFNRHPLPWSRKHYRGSYAADLWVHDLNRNKYQRILDDNLPDEQKPNNMWPMYANGEIYFVSDREVMAKSGTPEVMKSVNNIWKIAESGGRPTQVTFHKGGNLYYPSLSADRRAIVYEENFGIWKLDLATGQTREVKIDITADDAENQHDTITVNSEADSFHVSPSGKRAVISIRGELFNIPTDKGDVRRLTNTSGARETTPQWSPDGKLIAYASDQSGREEVYLSDERGGNVRQISKGDIEISQLAWAPDGKSLLYTASDNKLRRYTVDGDKTDVISTTATRQTNVQWSPDGKWILYMRSDDNLLPHVYLIPAEGGQERRLTRDDTYSDTAAAWTPDGKKIVYLSGMDVPSPISGVQGRGGAQLYVVSLLPEEKNPSEKGIDSEADAVEAEKRFPRPGPKGAEPQPKGKVEVKIDFNNLSRRARQLTRVADNISGLAVAPDSRSVAFVTSGVEGGRRVTSIWSVSLDGGTPSRIVQASTATEEEGPPQRRGFGGFGGLTGLQFSKDGRTLFYKQGKSIYAATVGGGGLGAGAAAASGKDETQAPTPTPTPGGRFGGGAAAAGGAQGRKLNFTATIEVDFRTQRRQVFNEAWRVMKHRFYDPAMHGVNWDAVRAHYEPLLAHTGDQEELHNVVSMMLGELNASHTGISGGGRGRGADTGESRIQTRFPGFDMKADPSGYYRVTHIYRDGPADKDYVKVRDGDYILAIDEQPLKAGDSYYKLLTGTGTGRIAFTVNSEPKMEGAWTTKITPVPSQQQQNLQYEKWVADRKAMVEKLSGGQIGYLHIRAMSEPNLRQFERDLAMLHNKKALVIDQRFNPGGNIDQELLQILQQKQYQKTRNRGSIEVTRPARGYFGPMVVMQNERSTSDAEVFPDGFRTLKLGKLVGVTTYGAVIGTGAFQLMDGSSIRTPGSGLWNVNGTNLENNGIVPDVYVDNTPEDFFLGRDAQLEKAVEVLRDQLASRK